MNKLKLGSIIILLILSMTSIHAQETNANVAITLERTPCFGTCPVYQVSIFEDGTVMYNGENFVDISGEQTSSIDPETVELMVNAFVEAGYFEWDEAYDTRTVTDLPTITTSVTYNGETHQIMRYAGDTDAPLVLPYLEQWIDEMASTGMWTGAEAGIANVPSMTPPAITIERQPCYGFCPTYKAALFEDGTVVYIGIANVDHLGVHTFEVEAFNIESVIQEANAFGYFDWDDSYEDYFITDQSTIITTIQTDEHYKHIARYNGDPNAPVGLVWIEDRIDSVLEQAMIE